LAGKRLELLKETVPGLSRVGILIDPSRAAAAHVRQAAVAARKLEIELHVVEVRSLVIWKTHSESRASGVLRRSTS
jgi:ABC-type uncharacterized transport system substrate-binding protein